MPVESSGQIRYLSTNSTASAYTITPGRTLTRPSNLFSVGGLDGKRQRALEVTAFGAGADNSDFGIKCYGVKRCISIVNGVTEVDWDVYLILEVATCTLGTMLGVGTIGGIMTTDRVADTMSAPTLDAYHTKSVAAYGGVTASVHSPAGNGEARLFIPDVGNAEFVVFDFDMGTATSGNLLIERGT